MALNSTKSLRYAALVLALLALTATSSFAQQQQSSGQSTGDPVADAARKAREKQKKDADKPKKVYTDDDVNHYVPDNAASSEKSAAQEKAAGKEGAAKEGSAKETAPAEADKTPEQQWRKRFREAYGKLAQLEKELDILQREDNKAQVQYYSDPQKAMEEQYTRKEINEKNAKIAAKKNEIAQQKQHISDMEDDLRKAGGDPGWARP